MPEKIGFVGVGRMGANMARRLAECGYAVHSIYDVHRPAAAALAKELKAQASSSLAEVAAASDVIFTVVSDDRAMLEIFSRKRDNLLQGARGKLFINCATITPSVHVKVEQMARKAGAEILEACMASSITQARQGTLYLMCGGARGTFDRAKPLLTRLSDDGKLLRYIGPAGAAAQVKALVNMVMNINTAGLAEGLALGDALGLDLGMLREVFSQTGAASRVLQTDGEDMQNREHSCFFSAAHAAKDSGIASSLARSKKLDLPLATVTFRQYTKMVKVGLGELDKSGIAELTFRGRGSPRERIPQGGKRKRV